VQQREVWHPLAVVNDPLAIEQEGRGFQFARSVDDPGEALSPIGTSASERTHAVIVLTHHEPVSVVFDFVDRQQRTVALRPESRG
jgi:hypothetical protein